MTAIPQHSGSATAAFTALRRQSRALKALFAGTASIATLTLIPHPGSPEALRLADVAVPTASGRQFPGGFATDEDDDQAQHQEQQALQQMQQAEQQAEQQNEQAQTASSAS